MRRILKIYDLLKFEDLEKIVTLLPEIKDLFPNKLIQNIMNL